MKCINDVIRGLKLCRGYGMCTNECPYYDHGRYRCNELTQDALGHITLLQKHEKELADALAVERDLAARLTAMQPSAPNAAAGLTAAECSAVAAILEAHLPERIRDGAQGDELACLQWLDDTVCVVSALARLKAACGEAGA